MTYTTVDELQERLDWTLTDGERKVAQGALEDLSEWAMFYGKAWPVETVPSMVVRLVLAAAGRFMRNFEGLDTSRAGDETVIFQKQVGTTATAEFSEKEIRAIRQIAHPNLATFHSLQMTAYGNSQAEGDGLVPVVNGEPFPYYSNSEPW